MSNILNKVFYQPFESFIDKITLFFPNLMLFTIMIFAGLIISFFVKLIIKRLLKAISFDRLSDHLGIKLFLSKGGISKSPTELLSIIVFWLVLISFLMLGISSLNLPIFNQIIFQIVTYFPRLFSAIIILILGFIFANFFARAALIASVNAGLESAKLISKGLQFLIMIFTFAMALDQLEISKHIVVATFSIIFGGIVLSMAIAFGLGGRDIAKRLLEKNLFQEKDEEDKSDKISHI